MNIVLLGFMGAGKSSLGPRLAALSGREYLDLDALLEEERGLSIAEIFRQEGEDTFRDWEGEVLRRAVAREGIVLSTGGGIVERGENHAPLRRARGIYLFWPWRLLGPRLERARRTGTRPLLEEGERALRERWRRREPRYRALADLVFSPLDLDGQAEREAGLAGQAAGIQAALERIGG